jgi:hypothetical protein
LEEIPLMSLPHSNGWKKEINVVIKNIGLETMPQGVKNPIAKLLTGILASIYELERQNIMERSTQELPHILPEVVLLDVKKDLQFPTQSSWIN